VHVSFFEIEITKKACIVSFFKNK